MVGRTTLRRVAGAALTAALISLGASSSASAVVPGGLVAKSCLTSVALNPCAPIAANILGTSTRVITSPNGNQVYALTTLSGPAYSLLTFTRESDSGQLTLKDCIRSTAVS